MLAAMDVYRNAKLAASSGVATETYAIRPLFPVDARQPADVVAADRMSVTGIPSVALDLDEPVNTLDPGQLLRESAAAATRAALQSHHHVTRPRRQFQNGGRFDQAALVGQLLGDIYASDDKVLNDDGDASDAGDATTPPAQFLSFLHAKGIAIIYQFFAIILCKFLLIQL